MRKTVGWSDWIFFCVPAALGLGLFIARAFSEPDFLFNADALFYHGLYSDIFLDPHPLRGWQTPPSPLYFPELLQYFLLAGIANVFVTDPLVPAMLAWGGCALLWFAGVHVWLAGVLNIPRPKLSGLAAGVVLFTAGSLASTDHPWHYLLIPQYRGGTYFASLICAGLMFSMMQGGRGRRAWPAATAFVPVQALTAASDGVWFAWFALPAGAALVFTAWRLPERRATALRVLLLHGVAVLAGLWLNRIFADVFPWLRPDVTFYARLPTLAVMLERVPQLLVSRWYLPVFALSLVPAMILTLRRNQDERVSFAAVFAVASALAVYGAMLAADPELPFTLRYFGAPFAYLAAGAIFLAAHAARARPIFIGIGIGIGLGLVLFAALAWFAFGRGPSAGSPIACVRKLAVERSLQAGLADYWNAKYLRYRVGLPVNQVGPNLEPYYWINNFYWYFDDTPYDFVVTDRLDPAQIKARFGEPADVVHCGASEIFVYGRPEDEALRTLHDFRAAEIELWQRGTGR